MQLAQSFIADQGFQLAVELFAVARLSAQFLGGLGVLLLQYAGGFTMGQDDASAAYATSIEKMSARCQRLEHILYREPQDRIDLLAIAEKLKLAADTFRAVKSESQVPQALALRDKALSMAAALDSFFQEDAA
ncbi:hypothetical protein ACRCF9_11675 [Pseudomonas canadensis]|uniref:hypothetical protein n=1 Tax=Pseudomonas TaxID=286 RepID=UPI003D6BB41F